MDYETDEKSDQAFSRLTWTVEKVDNLTEQLMTNYTVSTNRPWVGVYDKEKMEFGLTEPRGFFNMKFPPIAVRGQITARDNKTLINIKLRLEGTCFIFYLILYLGTAVMIASVVVFRDIGDIRTLGGLAVWILVFPVFNTFLLNRKLNKIERKVEDLFGVR